MVERHVLPQVKQFFNADENQLANSGSSLRYFLQPVPQIHLDPSMMGDVEPLGDRRYVWVFGIVAAFILLIACINFINLSTARASGRAREVGVRKAIGATRGELVGQFMAESLLVSLVSFFIEVLLAWAILPFFASLADKQLAFPFANPLFWLWAFVGAIGVGLLAGFYPALVISGFESVDALRGKIQTGRGAAAFRQGLVVFQFTISIALIIGATVVDRQMRYLQNRKMGFDRDQVLVIEEAYLAGKNLPVLRNRLEGIAGVESASLSSFLPVVGEFTNNTIFWPTGKHQVENELLVYNWEVDFQFISTLGLEIIAGRAFSEAFPTDSQAVILNETAVRAFGFESPLGMRLSKFWGNGSSEDVNEKSLTVIGVVRDFAFGGVKDNVKPVALEVGSWGRLAILKVSAGQVDGLLREVEAIWRDVAPGQPFTYFFMDEKFDRMVRDEGRIGKVFLVFSGLAIAIACLGLFALAAFMVERRAKEISVRKVLGANSGQIVSLFTREFMLLVTLALCIATPLGLYGIELWLQGFAFRVHLGEAALWGVLTAGFSATAIAMATVSSTAIRASLARPAANLRGD